MKINWMPLFQFMPYLDSYGNCIEDDITTHVCQNCLNQVDEAAGIRGAALVHSSYYDTLAADPEDESTWQDGIDAGTIVVLPDTRGSFDGGTAISKPGWGGIKTITTGYDFKATIADRVYIENWAFYKSIFNKSSYHLVYVTGTQGHLTPVTVSFTPHAAVSEDVGDIVTWSTDVAWTDSFSPAPFTAPADIFKCTAT